MFSSINVCIQNFQSSDTFLKFSHEEPSALHPRHRFKPSGEASQRNVSEGDGPKKTSDTQQRRKLGVEPSRNMQEGLVAYSARGHSSYLKTSLFLWKWNKTASMNETLLCRLEHTWQNQGPPCQRIDAISLCLSCHNLPIRWSSCARNLSHLLCAAPRLVSSLSLIWESSGQLLGTRWFLIQFLLLFPSVSSHPASRVRLAAPVQTEAEAAAAVVSIAIPRDRSPLVADTALTTHFAATEIETWSQFVWRIWWGIQWVWPLCNVALLKLFSWIRARSCSNGSAVRTKVTLTRTLHKKCQR